MENDLIKKSYTDSRRGKWAFISVLFVSLIFISIISLARGSYELTFSQVFYGLLNKADNKINLIVRTNRLPRIISAIVAGAGLGMTGAVLQAILQNPMASASTLGVSQGANFGAALAIIAFGFKAGDGIGLAVLAFFGALVVAAFILALSKFQKLSSYTVLLAGVAISAMLSGATMVMQYFADEVQLASLIHWTFGDLASASTSQLILMGGGALIFAGYSFFHRWDYNALLLGDEAAVNLGIDVSKLIIINMLLSCLVSSIVISAVGLISFVGLLAPHLVKMVLGNNYTYLLPASLLSGSIILLLSDLLSRSILSPIILPIGAITSFMGGPIFLYLLYKGRDING